jgi:succinyl-CoA synthetase beta subunit
MRALLRSGPLNEAESKQLFARFGIPSVRETAVATAEEAERSAKAFTGNVVIKVLSRDVLHKSEMGGVAVNVAPADVAHICAAMTDRFTKATQLEPEGFLVQEMIVGGVELILGFHRDPQLGHVVLLGTGGVMAEIYRDTVLRLAPVSRRDAQEMVEELKSKPLLKGFRGRPPADIGSLIEAIVAFSTMISTIGHELEEAEINPLFVLPQGRGVAAADGLVLVKSRRS